MAEDDHSARRADGKQDGPRRSVADLLSLEALMQATFQRQPSVKPMGQALADFVRDMALAKMAYAVERRAGSAAAAMAGVQFCHAIGRTDLTDPFIALANGLEDVRENRDTPSIFRKKGRRLTLLCHKIC